MKRILIAVPNDALGGAEQFLRMIALHYSVRDYYVKVLFLKASVGDGWKIIANKNIELIYTKAISERKGIIPFLINILKFRHTHFDYIFTSHVHITGTLGFLRRLKLLKATYYVGRESTSIFMRFKGIKLFILKVQYFIGYNSLDLLICQTQLMKNQLIKGVPGLEGKIKIIVLPNPLNLSAIPDIETRQLETHENYIISAGRLIPEKGFDILINSFKKVRDLYPTLELIILGEGPLRNELENLRNGLNLNESVHLPGFQTNVFSYFRNAQLCVVSSRIEGFPNVLLQMMSQNNKVVSTKCAGEIENIDGLYITETSAVGLSNAIISALETDTSKNRDLFDVILQERSIENFVAQVEKHLTGGE